MKAWLRREAFGFVFQGFNLLPRMNALENVAMPMGYANVRRDERDPVPRDGDVADEGHAPRPVVDRAAADHDAEGHHGVHVPRHPAGGDRRYLLLRRPLPRLSAV